MMMITLQPVYKKCRNLTSTLGIMTLLSYVSLKENVSRNATGKDQKRSGAYPVNK